MDDKMTRRGFLGTVGTVAAASVALAPLAQSVLAAQTTQGARAAGAAGRGATAATPTPIPIATHASESAAALSKTTPYKKVVLEPFDYSGVTLRDGFWQRQAQSARDFYLGLSNDDILHGYRVAAGQANAPGRALGGWCSPNSNTVFGQWLQSMARMQRANGDKEMLDKANVLVSEYAKCWAGMTSGAGARAGGRGGRGGGGGGGLGNYAYEKLAGGLIDMHHYAGHPEALALCDKITEANIPAISQARVPANREPWEMHSGRPGEWYTMAENLYRIYELTGNSMYKDFGDIWLYHAYWDKFAEPDPKDAQGVHAYSHANSFASAALAYDVTGDEKYLTILKNFYDWMQKRQTYATGGYGPDERFVYSDGALGDALEVYSASFECPCCSWAAFKTSKYLMMYTGEARFGDWIERLLYNGVGAALPIKDRGVHMYYMDYHLGSDLKYYSRNTFTCCSGTYFQNIAEYQNLVYFKDPKALYVNLYMPSEVEWKGAAGTVKVAQSTDYPDDETSSLKLTLEQPATFALKFRVPGWSKGMSLKVNGAAQTVDIKPGQWATISREWKSGDTVLVTIPLHFRRVPIDEQHPNRVALVRGPAVYGQEDPHKWLSDIPADDEALDKLMVPLDNDPAIFQINNEPVASQRNAFKPFYRFVELERYRMYFDAKSRRVLW